MISISLPWPARELSPNSRAHYMAKHRKAKMARTLAAYLTMEAGVRRNDPDIPETIEATFVFFPPSRRKYDDDNLLSSCKAYRDGIADAMGVDDNRFRIKHIIKADPRRGGSVRIELGVAP